VAIAGKETTSNSGQPQPLAHHLAIYCDAATLLIFTDVIDILLIADATVKFFADAVISVPIPIANATVLLLPTPVGVMVLLPTSC
jgi:hypothetical protein